MAAGDGHLPASATARLERQRASGTAGSMLSVPAAAAVQAAGLAPVGEVFGCFVMNLGWSGGYCGVYQWQGSPYSMGMSMSTPVVTSGEARGSRNGFGPYVAAVERAWRGALGRMLAEAQALGADGVVGVVTATTTLQGRVREFTATGTAVRSTDPGRGPASAGRLGSPGREPDASGSQPWCARMSGEDCAAAILAGYPPRGMALGMSVATKHEDWQLQQQVSSFSNTEVTGWTSLVTAAREQAASRLAADGARSARHGIVVVDAMSVSTFETACGEAKDLHAEAFVTATVLDSGAARPREATARLTIMPVLPLSDRP